jgi:hypothetical protein
LIRASTAGLLGRLDEGKRFTEQVMDLKPDFAEEGRKLIGHFIKFDDIAEKIIEGLDRSGVKIK